MVGQTNPDCGAGTDRLSGLLMYSQTGGTVDVM